MATTSGHSTGPSTGLRRGLTIWRNVIPYPEGNPGQWSPIVAFGWVLLAAIAVVLSPGPARRLSVSLEKSDGAA